MRLETLSALQLGNLVNKRELSCEESIRYFADRIEARNPSLNAFTYTKIDEALEVARQKDASFKEWHYLGPFAGVPVALKDFLPAKKGWTASHGGVKSFITVDNEDCTFWKAAEELGAIAIGKTNAPSFGFRGTTYNKMYGNTHNPFNLDYNSGGSSGGSCAAVGGLLVPISSCGDAGGSTRCPSAWCSCFGFKPSAGIVPSVCRPDAWAATHPYCCDGPATRTIEDSAIMMEHMMKYDPKDPLSVPIPHKNFRELMKRDVKSLKIAVTYDYDLFPAVDNEIKEAVNRTASILSSVGAIVEYVHFSFKHSLQEMEEAWLRGISIDSALDLDIMAKSGFDLLNDHSEDLPDQFVVWTKEAFKSSMLDYRRFHDIRTDILDAMLSVLSKYDIIISPVTSCMPVKNTEDTKGPEEINGVSQEGLIGFCQTWLQNMAGNPAASVPAGLGSNNLPIGVQVIGRRYFDEDVYTIAYALEQLNPWYQYYERIVI